MANSFITAGVEQSTSANADSQGKQAMQPKDTRVYMYREGEAKLFDKPEDIPPNEGWVDHPDKVKPRKEEKPQPPKAPKAKEH